MSPILFREYANDFPQCMNTESVTWKKGEEEDELDSNDGNNVMSVVSASIMNKNVEEKSPDEKWDEILRNDKNKIESWNKEKTGIGPEPQLIPSDLETSADACIYADDNSAGEEAVSKEELKEKTEQMLQKIFNHMKACRLSVNERKPKVMLFATRQKRARNELEFNVNINASEIKEVERARLLGVELSNDFSWNAQINETLKECSNRLNGLYKIREQLDLKQRKALVESSILSRLRYALEVTSSGTESDLNKLASMQSKSARYILGTPRKEWSRTQGYTTLNWSTI